MNNYKNSNESKFVRLITYNFLNHKTCCGNNLRNGFPHNPPPNPPSFSMSDNPAFFHTYNMNVSRELKKPSKYRHIISQYVQCTYSMKIHISTQHNLISSSSHLTHVIIHFQSLIYVTTLKYLGRRVRIP